MMGHNLLKGTQHVSELLDKQSSKSLTYMVP